MPYFAVYYAPPRPNVFLDGISVTAGQTLAVTCLYRGYPPPAVRWLKDGQQVSAVWPDGGIFMVVELKDVSESFVLTCLVDNGLDTVSVHVFVNVTSGKNNNPGLFTIVYYRGYCHSSDEHKLTKASVVPQQQLS